MLVMDQEDVIAAAIEAAGGTRKVQEAAGLKSPESVRVWIKRGVPAEHVILLAALGGWRYPPNAIASELYPHPDDGLPTDRRNGGPYMAEASA
jgi:hypothetical protein